jgi:hypothetical protein
MDERQDKDRQDKDKDEGRGSASGKNAERDAANAAANGDLPSVEAPNLAGGEASAEPAADSIGDGRKADIGRALPVLFREPVDEELSEPEAAAPTAQPRTFRFALLAATIAAAAGIGSVVGSLTASGLGHKPAAAVAIPKFADSRDVISAMKAQLAELAALKASLEANNRSAAAQFARVGERLDSLQRAEADPTAKLAHIADAVDRLEQQTATAPDITGAIAASPPPQSSVSPPAPPSVIEANAAGPILPNWQVEEVHGGRALVASRYGAEFLVGAGSVLPGLGRVQDVKRQNGRWIVVTEKGLITSLR